MKIFTFLTLLMITLNLNLFPQNSEEDYKKAVAYFNKANTYKQNYDFGNALNYFSDAAELFKKYDHYTGNYIQCRYSVSDIFILQNKFKEAQKVLDEIDGLSVQKYGDENQFHRYIFYGKGLLSSVNGKNDEALEYYTKALKINDNQTNPDIFLRSNLYGGLGNVYSEKGDLTKALEYYQKDINAKKGLVGGNHPILAVGYNNIAGIYRVKAEYDQALNYIDKALELSLNAYGDQHVETAKYYLAKGKVNMDKGQYDLAEEFYKTSLEINTSRLGRKHKTVIDNLIDFGILYNIKGDLDKSLIYFKDAYDIHIDMFGNDHPDIAGLSNNIGNVLRKQEKYESSIKYYQKAIDLKKKYFGPNHIELGVYYNNMGLSYFSIGNYNSSLMFYLKAADIIESNYGSKFPRLVRTYANIGNIYLKQEDFFKSLLYYQKSISANVKSFNPAINDYYSNPAIIGYTDINNLLISLKGKADAFYKLYNSDTLVIKNLEYSYENYILCDSVINIARKKVEKKSDKVALGNRSKEIYDLATSSSIQLSYHAKNDKLKEKYQKKAFYFAENNKAVILSGAVTESEVKNFVKIPDDILLQEKFFKEMIANEEVKLSEAKEDNLIKIYENNLFKLNEDLRKFNEKIEREYPKYHELKYKSSELKVEDIQSYLDSESAVISYFSGQDFIIVFYITKNDLSVLFSEKPDNFEKSVKDYKNYLVGSSNEDVKNYNRMAYEFYELLFPEELPEGIKKITVITDGSIGLIPFESLFTEKYTGNLNLFNSYPYLIKKCQISYAYSAGLLVKNLKNKKGNNMPKSWLGLAPVFENIQNRNINGINASVLPGTKEEIKKIESLLRSKGYKVKTVMNDKATESYFKYEDFSNYKYVHIATHGIVDAEKPQLSGLLLYNKYADGVEVLYSGEIYNLEMDVDLAVLSACETGYGKIQKSEGIIGLSRSLLFAGANNIIVSLWKVSDASTTKLMVDFYTFLMQDENDKTGALHKAKIKMINSGGDHSHPFFWSPFILIGR